MNLLSVAILLLAAFLIVGPVISWLRSPRGGLPRNEPSIGKIAVAVAIIFAVFAFVQFYLFGH